MSAKMIQLTQGGVMKYPRTIANAIAVVEKSKLLSTVLTELGEEDARLAGLIEAAEAKITTLNGTGEGSVDKKIGDAIDKFATEITDNGVIDSFKELVDYVAAHGSEFSAVLGRVSAAEGKIEVLEGKVEALEGDNTTNKANIESNTQAINGLNGKVGSSADAASYEGSLYARIAQLKADLEAMGGEEGSVSEQIDEKLASFKTANVDPIAADVNTIKGDYLKASDKQELQNNINGKVAQTAYDAKVIELEGAISTNKTNAETGIQEAKDAAAAADAKGAQGISDAAAAQSKADSAYELAESKIGYVVIGDTTYPDFDEIALS